MAFTVRPIDGARKGDYDDLHGVLKPQRLINWNIRVSTDLYSRRKAIAEDPNLSDDRRYGSALTTGRGMPGDLLNLNENEVLLGSRRGGDPGSWSHLTEPEAYGFQSLNGVHIPPGYTEEDMADRHPVIGISRSAYIVSPNVPEQMAHGVAAAVSGSMPLLNNSPKLRPWRPRDMLVARWPSTDPIRRKAEEDRKPRADGVDHQRLTVYIEPATYVETRLYFERDLTLSFEDGQKPNFSARQYFERGTKPGGLSPSQRAVATTRGTLQLAAFGLIAMLLGHSYDDNELLDNIRDPVVFRAAVAGETLDIIRRNHPNRAQLEQRLIAWAGALGCTLGYAANSVEPDGFLNDHIVGLALRPLIMNADSNYFDITNLFSEARAATARTKDGALGVLPNIADAIGGIAWAQGVYAPGMLAGLKGSIERLQNRYVGHALDYTAPGSLGGIYRC